MALGTSRSAVLRRFVFGCVFVAFATTALWIGVRAATSDQLRVGVISTFAGTGTAGVGGDGAAATSAQLNNPSGVAVDSSGNVYIADTNNNRIRRVAAGTGVISTFAGTGASNFSGDSGQATSATMRLPNSVALDNLGNLYIADTNNHRIRRVVIATGIITTYAGNGSGTYGGDNGQATAASLQFPYAVATDFAGNVYVADSYNHRIRKVTAATGVITTIAGTGTAGYNGDGTATNVQLYYPWGVGVDSGGNVFIADRNNLRVRKVTLATGNLSTIAGTGAYGYSGEAGPALVAQIGYLDGLTVDASDNIYLSDDYHDSVRKIAAGTSIITTVAGSTDQGVGGDGGAAPAGTLHDPSGVAVDATGAFYIADSQNHRIRKVSAPSLPSYLMSTLAGTGTAGYNGDGPAAGARLYYPGDVAVDAAGNVYIADTSDYRIRKVTVATGIISTYAGTGSFGYSGDSGPATSANIGTVYGLAFDSAGNLYFSDTDGNRVRKVAAATGIISTVAGNGSQGFGTDNVVATTTSLYDPMGLAVDSAGNLFIADSNNNRIRKVSVGTNIITTVAGNGTAGVAGDGAAATAAQLRTPQGVAVDSSGNLYIADTNNHRIRKVTAATGVISTVVGTGTAGYAGENGLGTNAQINLPYDVALDAGGNVFIADRNNHRIRKFNVSNNLLTTVVGNGQAGFDGDGGVSPAAALYYPYGVAVDSIGDVYVADTYDHRVRKAGVPLDPPTNLTAVPLPAGVRLSWAAPSGASTFNIFRGTASGSETLLAANVAGTTFTDTSAVRGQRYFYFVSANFVGVPGPGSGEIVFRYTVAAGDVNGDGLADVIWRNSITGANVSWFMNGVSFAGQTSFASVSDPAWQLVASADFNGDAHLDLVWRNTFTGANVIWLMNGTTFLGQVNLPTVADPAWELVTAADVNQDGNADLIWRNLMSGADVVWYLNGTTLVGQGFLPTVADLAWTLAGAGDVNFDGWPDLFWRNTATGANLVWLMNGTSAIGAVALPTVTDPAWIPRTVIDLNADGWPDLLWRHSGTGANVAWLLNGAVLASQVSLSTVSDPAWQMIGPVLPEIPTDVNNDRHPDLVWRNTSTGANLVWYLNGTSVLGQDSFPTVADLNWQIVAKADLNRDGHPDLIWRNSATGENVVWYLNGTSFLAQTSLPTVSDLAWKIAGVGDFNNDQHADIVWRNSSTGDDLVWYLNDTIVLGQSSLTSVSDPNWKIMAVADINGDAHPDLVWRNSVTGGNVVWYLNNTTFLGQDAYLTVPDTSWQIVTAVDVNSDGHADLIWHNTSTGATLVWYMNGTTLLAQAPLPTVSDLNWTLRPN